jgi:predicted amidophosphoribosyltransferase
MLDLLLPRPCAGCGAADGPWCEGCDRALPLGLIRTAVPLGVAGDLDVVASTGYRGRGRRLLLAFKGAGRHELAPVLGALLAHAVLGAVLLAEPGGERRAGIGPEGIALVPVPSRPGNRRARGADLGLLLARSAAAHLRRAGWAAQVEPVLRHAAGSADQAGLNRRDRARNIANTLVAGGPMAYRRTGEAAGEPVLRVLVDDILTSGATLREAARAMRAAGFPRPGGAVVAATPGDGDHPLSSPDGGV